jgi:hypothetical protein
MDGKTKEVEMLRMAVEVLTSGIAKSERSTEMLLRILALF